MAGAPAVVRKRKIARHRGKFHGRLGRSKPFGSAGGPVARTQARHHPRLSRIEALEVRARVFVLPRQVRVPTQLPQRRRRRRAPTPGKRGEQFPSARFLPFAIPQQGGHQLRGGPLPSPYFRGNPFELLRRLLHFSRTCSRTRSSDPGFSSLGQCGKRLSRLDVASHPVERARPLPFGATPPADSQALHLERAVIRCQGFLVVSRRKKHVPALAKILGSAQRTLEFGLHAHKVFLETGHLSERIAHPDLEPTGGSLF